jgi:hypothetical protein
VVGDQDVAQVVRGASARVRIEGLVAQLGSAPLPSWANSVAPVPRRSQFSALRGTGAATIASNTAPSSGRVCSAGSLPALSSSLVRRRSAHTAQRPRS